jgi:hypothetical protein
MNGFIQFAGSNSANGGKLPLSILFRCGSHFHYAPLEMNYRGYYRGANRAGPFLAEAGDRRTQGHSSDHRRGFDLVQRSFALRVRRRVHYGRSRPCVSTRHYGDFGLFRHSSRTRLSRGGSHRDGRRSRRRGDAGIHADGHYGDGSAPGEESDPPAARVAGRQYAGRIITVANDKIFGGPVNNYAKQFPYLWGEMRSPIPNKRRIERAEQALTT